MHKNINMPHPLDIVVFLVELYNLVVMRLSYFIHSRVATTYNVMVKLIINKSNIHDVTFEYMQQYAAGKFRLDDFVAVIRERHPISGCVAHLSIQYISSCRPQSYLIDIHKNRYINPQNGEMEGPVRFGVLPMSRTLDNVFD
jgi:hypothetical protein